MISSRTRNIIVTTQFNINGSRGSDAGKFVSDYVSRDAATDKSSAYIHPPNRPYEDGDGVAFTLDSSAISRNETLNIADRVQSLHLKGNRAIQQMVISFDPDYLQEQNIVPHDVTILGKGDYQHEYDDVRLRHAIRQGLQSMIDAEGYGDGRAIACIQHDTRHLHVHAVVYEDAKKIARKRGYEEKGVIKESSLNQLTFDVDRNLTLTRTNNKVPTEKVLIPDVKVDTPKPVIIVAKEPIFVNKYLQVLQSRQRAEALRQKTQKIISDREHAALAMEAEVKAKEQDERNKKQEDEMTSYDSSSPTINPSLVELTNDLVEDLVENIDPHVNIDTEKK